MPLLENFKVVKNMIQAGIRDTSRLIKNNTIKMMRGGYGLQLYVLLFCLVTVAVL